jgi:hypothetical protein
MLIANFVKIGQLIQKLNGETPDMHMHTHTCARARARAHTHTNRYLELIRLHSFLKKGQQAKNKDAE